MKPDWQNKSFAKTGSPAAPSTTHPKLKIGMSSLHSKIAVANHNTAQAKPAVRKMADGGFMGRGGRMETDEEYQARMEQGAKNWESVKNFWGKLTGKEAKASPSNITGDSGMSASDVAKKEAIAGGMKAVEAPKEEVKVEEPRRKIEDYIKTAPASPQEVKSEESPAAEPAKPAKQPKTAKTTEPSVSSEPVTKPAKSTISRSNVAGQSQRDVEARANELKLRASAPSMGSVPDTGDETARIMARSGTKFVPGFGYVDKEGNIVKGQKTAAGPSIGDALQAVDKSMTDAGVRFLKSKMDRGETLTALEKAQAKRAGIL